MRLGLERAIPGCFFRPRRSAHDFVGSLRRSRLLLSRGDDFRLPPFRFECLAKVAVKYLAETRNHCLGTPQVSCRSWWQTKASEVRGAVVAGQGFVFANSAALPSTNSADLTEFLRP